MIAKKDKRYLGRSFSVGATFTVLATMATVAWASAGTVQDKRITFDNALQLARAFEWDKNFPITINEQVVKELNRYVGTPDGREFIRNSLRRMANYQSFVNDKLDQYRLPRELGALPIMESGYQNLSQSPLPQYAAGLWQFIPQTARNYGMRVDKVVDER